MKKALFTLMLLAVMGSAFAQRLQGFECRIMAYDKYKPAGFAPSYVEAVSLAHLQEHADVLSLHVPLTLETHHMVNSQFISNFSHPFYLINTSRGAVVSTPDLAEAIEQQKIAGAALDVIEYEDMTRDRTDGSGRRFPLSAQQPSHRSHSPCGWMDRRIERETGKSSRIKDYRRSVSIILNTYLFS